MPGRGTPNPHGMVPLVTVANGFQARVVAARLGAAGVVAQLSGGVDGPYPIGDVRIDVLEDDAELARQLLLADQIEEAFGALPRRAPAQAGVVRHRLRWAPWIVLGAAVITETLAVAARLA
jgi:hypothetical protein